MPISPFPTPAPSRSDAADVFVERADATVAHFKTFTDEANTLQIEVNSTAAESQSAANAASLESTNAANSATVAESHANTAASAANFKGSWSSLSGALNVPSSVLHNTDYWQLVNVVADVTLSEPSVDNSDWAYISSSSALPAENLYLHSIYGGL